MRHSVKRTSVVASLLACAVPQLLAAQDPGVRLVHDEANKEFVIVIGPVDLPVPSDEGAMHMRGAHAPVFPPIETVQVPIASYLTGFSYEVVRTSGEVLPTDILHHLNIINPDNRELFLPISQRMLALGNETGSQSMPGLLLGYPVPAGTNMVVSTMLHNPTGERVKGVEVRVHLKYIKAGRPWPLFSVYPFQLDIAFPAGDKSVDLPPGRSQFSWEGSPSMDGRIMVVGSHLHELATSIQLEDVTNNKVLWEGFPVQDENGDFGGVTIGHVYRKLGIKLRKEKVYRVTVFYENSSSDTLTAGGMGVIAGVFMPSGGGAWPRADKADELYALDRRHYMQVVRGNFELIVSGGGVIGEAASDQHSEHEH